MMKLNFLMTLLFIMFALVSCNNSNNKLSENRIIQDEKLEVIKIDNMVQEEDECEIDDTIYHADMKYYDFDKVKDLKAFFNELALEHETLTGPDEPEEKQLIDNCLIQIERYRTGERKYYPDSLIQEALRYLGHSAADIYSHRPGVDLTYSEWLIMLFAYYCPDISYLVDMQSPDHLVGVRNFGNEYNYNPWWAYLLLKREKGYEVRLIGSDFVKIDKLFQFEDENHQKYYLCSNYTSILFFKNYLYWKKDSNSVILVASCDEVNDENLEYDELYFNPKTQTMSFCNKDTKSGKLIPITDKPAMTITLDGTNSKFN